MCVVSSLRLHNGVSLVTASGEIDLHTTPMLEHALARALAEGAAGLAVELSDCSFVDSTAIKALLRTQAQLNETDGLLSLVAPARVVRRALELTGATERFRVHESRMPALGI